MTLPMNTSSVDFSRLPAPCGCVRYVSVCDEARRLWADLKAAWDHGEATEQWTWHQAAQVALLGHVGVAVRTLTGSDFEFWDNHAGGAGMTTQVKDHADACVTLEPDPTVWGTVRLKNHDGELMAIRFGARTAEAVERAYWRIEHALQHGESVSFDRLFVRPDHVMACFLEFDAQPDEDG